MPVEITDEDLEFGYVPGLGKHFSSIITRPDLDVTKEEEDAFNAIPGTTIDPSPNKP